MTYLSILLFSVFRFSVHERSGAVSVVGE